jgi:hypothetical protein
MSCERIQGELSAYLDGDLAGARLHLVSAHLDSCAACKTHLQQLSAVSEELAALPHLVCPEPALAVRVLDRLEIESRGPGLALLFRSAWAARPLFLPSVLPAALILVCTLSTVLMMGARDLRSTTAARTGPSGNPFARVEPYMVPRSAADIFLDEQLVGLAEQNFFIETLVGQDGRVSQVNLIDGDSQMAAPILYQLRRQRVSPGRDDDGRPITARAFRLYTAMEVRAPIT